MNLVREPDQLDSWLIKSTFTQLGQYSNITVQGRVK